MKSLFIILVAFLSSEVLAATTEPHLVYLAPNSQLISIVDRKEIVTSRPLYVYVSAENPSTRTQYWVYDNKKEKKYLTDALNITELDSYTRLLPVTEGSKVYRQKRILQNEDRNIPLESSLTLHFEQISMGGLSAIYSEQINSAHATRYEIRTFNNSLSPVQFGLNLNFQSIYWPNGTEQIRLSVLSMGPGFAYKMIAGDSLTLSVLTSAELAPIAQSRSSLHTENFSAYSYGFGAEVETPSPIGIFTFGAHLRKYLLRLKNTTRASLGNKPSEYNLSSLGISVGYKVDWDL